MWSIFRGITSSTWSCPGSRPDAPGRAGRFGRARTSCTPHAGGRNGCNGCTCARGSAGAAATSRSTPSLPFLCVPFAARLGKRHPERAQEREDLLVVRRGRRDRHVEAADARDLVVVDLGEDDLF